MKAKIIITLKEGVLDPQGKAIEGALSGLGFDGVSNVRQGKEIELELNETDEGAARAKAEEMCKKLLACFAVVHNDRGNFRIAVMDLRRKDLLVLSAGSQDESPSFAPNSDTLIYATRQTRNGVLETVSADGLIRQRVTSGSGDVREPVWSPFPRF